MLTFSKRYEKTHPILRGYSRLSSKEDEDNLRIILDSRTRTRIQHQIVYMVKTGDYLKSFLTVNDEEDRSYHLHEPSLNALCGAELGFDPTGIMDTRPTRFIETDKPNDFYLFDLIELFIVFCKDSKRGEFIARLQSIFDEEDTGYRIHGYMVTKTAGSNLSNIIGLIENKTLRAKLNDYYAAARLSHDFKQLAKLSADIIQYIFSGKESSKTTKTESEEILKKIAESWSSGKKTEALQLILSNEVKNAKELNNRIDDIRHTDKFTIKIANPNFYKVIAERNMALAELAIMSVPEEYLINEDPEIICENYSKNFNVNLKAGWIIRAPEPPIDLSEIPF